jgi:hypothetical protein
MSRSEKSFPLLSPYDAVFMQTKLHVGMYVTLGRRHVGKVRFTLNQWAVDKFAVHVFSYQLDQYNLRRVQYHYEGMYQRYANARQAYFNDALALLSVTPRLFLPPHGPIMDADDDQPDPDARHE